MRSVKLKRPQDRDWLVTVACALGLFATIFVLVQIGVPLEIVLATLVLVCLGVCGWAAFVVSHARRKVEAAIRSLAEARRGSL